ncbi:hypothetical protein LTR56_025208 [Elasticomyces elasticus]|nr:hypothetical protein LTR56_025208 [Elasticomyces elasticus]KAK5740191.1 hypothetical protein LTS12_025022 [Elasticomyces elasticus]
MSDHRIGNDDNKRTVKLARIRDNQRRSRAVRKDYLNELEARVRRCRETEARASQELQMTARKVSEENQRLRQLLQQQGLSDIEVEGYSTHPESLQYPGATTIALESKIEEWKLHGLDFGFGNEKYTFTAQMGTYQHR